MHPTLLLLLVIAAGAIWPFVLIFVIDRALRLAEKVLELRHRSNR